MKKFISKEDLSSILNILIRIGGQIILLPLILRTVETNQIGLWYTFSAITSLSLIFDVLLSGSVSRLATAYKNGINTRVTGTLRHQNSNIENTSALVSLIGTSRAISLILASIYATLLSAIGSIWILPSITTSDETLQSHHLWLLCAISAAISLGYGQSNNILRGLNAITKANKHIISSYTLQTLLTSILLYKGYGVYSLPIGAAIGPIATEIQAQLWLNRNGLSSQPRLNKDVILSLAPSGLRMAGIYLGGYLFTQAITLTAAQKLNLETAAQLGLTLQLLKIISTISGVFAQNRSPEMTKNIIQKKHTDVIKSFKNAFSAGLLSLLLLSGVLLTIGNKLLTSIASNTSLIPEGALIILIMIKVVEFICDQFSTLVISSNQIPFAIPSIVTGALLYSLVNIMEEPDLTSILITALACATVIKASHTIHVGIKFLKHKT